MRDVPENELFSAYLDGELTADEQAQMEQLLAQSPAARQLLEEFRALSGTLQSLPVYQLREDLSERVLREVERRAEAGSPQRPDTPEPRFSFWQAAMRRVAQPRVWIWPMVAAAAALLLAVLLPEQGRRLAKAPKSTAPPAASVAGRAGSPDLAMGRAPALELEDRVDRSLEREDAERMPAQGTRADATRRVQPEGLVRRMDVKDARTEPGEAGARQMPVRMAESAPGKGPAPKADAMAGPQSTQTEGLGFRAGAPMPGDDRGGLAVRARPPAASPAAAPAMPSPAPDAPEKAPTAASDMLGSATPRRAGTGLLPMRAGKQLEPGSVETAGEKFASKPGGPTWIVIPCEVTQDAVRQGLLDQILSSNSIIRTEPAPEIREPLERFALDHLAANADELRPTQGVAQEAAKQAIRSGRPITSKDMGPEDASRQRLVASEAGRFVMVYAEATAEQLERAMAQLEAARPAVRWVARFALHGPPDQAAQWNWSLEPGFAPLEAKGGTGVGRAAGGAGWGPESGRDVAGAAQAVVASPDHPTDSGPSVARTESKAGAYAAKQTPVGVAGQQSDRLPQGEVAARQTQIGVAGPMAQQQIATTRQQPTSPKAPQTQASPQLEMQVPQVPPIGPSAGVAPKAGQEKLAEEGGKRRVLLVVRVVDSLRPMVGQSSAKKADAPTQPPTPPKPGSTPTKAEAQPAAK